MFLPRRWSVVVLVAMLTALLPLSGPGPAVAAESIPIGSGVAPPGSWVTSVYDGASSSLYTQGDWRVELHGNVDYTTYVTVRDASGLPALSLGFGAPGNRRLEPGSYPVADDQHADDATAYTSLAFGSSECSGARGGFVVRDIAPDLSRLWLTYLIRCGPAGRPITGEVRIGEPAGDGYDVAPTRVDWPSTTVGDPGRLVPVTVLNPGPGPLHVAGTSVEDGPFAIGYSTCEDREVAEDGFCRVWVQYHPQAAGPRDGSLRVRTDRGPRVVELTGAAEVAVSRAARPAEVDADAVAGASDPAVPGGLEGTTSVRIENEAVGWLEPGSVSLGGDQVRSAFGNDNQFVVKYGDPGYEPSGTLRFQPDADQLMLPGTVVDRFGSSATDPSETGGLAFAINGLSCDNTVGRFRVTESAFDLTGRMTRMVVTFNARCWDGDPSPSGEVRGVIAYRALDDVPNLPASIPPPEPEPAPEPEPEPEPVPGVEPPSALDTRLVLRRAAGQPTIVHTPRARLAGRLVPRGARPRLREPVVVERWVPRLGAWRLAARTWTRADGSYRATVKVSGRRAQVLRSRYAGSEGLRASRSSVVRLRVSTAGLTPHR